MDTELWINFQKEMNMVWHDFHLDDLELVFLGNLCDKFLQSCIYAVHQNLAAVFWAEHDMILAGINDIMIGVIDSFAHIYIILLQAI